MRRTEVLPLVAKILLGQNFTYNVDLIARHGIDDKE
jgi:hypothetical protein